MHEQASFSHLSYALLKSGDIRLLISAENYFSKYQINSVSLRNELFPGGPVCSHALVKDSPPGPSIWVQQVHCLSESRKPLQGRWGGFFNRFISVGQTALVIGCVIATSGALLSGKRKRGGGKVDLRSANLKACKNPSGDLFQAGPTGLSIRLVGGRGLDALKKNPIQLLCFLTEDFRF